MYPHGACSPVRRAWASDHHRFGTGDFGSIETAVANAFAVPLAELRAPTRRTASAAFARQTAIYLAHTLMGLSYSAVARAVGRDRTTVAHACRVLEQRRDDPAIDAIVVRLEHVVGARARELAPTQRQPR
jgi:chromosomal replication initiation ATPase DnaA